MLTPDGSDDLVGVLGPAEIPCCGSSRKTGIRRRFKRFLSTDNGVGVDEQLAGDSNQDDFWRLARGGQAGDEGGEWLVVPFGTEGTHVERAA